MTSIRTSALTVVVIALALLVPTIASTAAPAPAPLPVNVDVDYQLGGGYRPARNVGIVVRDSTEPPVAGAYNVCYLNAFQTQPGTKRWWRAKKGLVLQHRGRPVVDAGWPDEWLLDISTAAKRKRLTRIVGGWIRGCARDGYQAVEFDNFDSFERSRGLVKARQANAFARSLVRVAHRAGLAAGQKNRPLFNGRRIGFDFVVAESCAQWNECAAYVAHFGSKMLAIEYRPQDFRTACAQIGTRVPVVYADRDLTPDGPRAWC